jgi:hypothetical protein
VPLEFATVCSICNRIIKKMFQHVCLLTHSIAAPSTWVAS